MSFWAEANRKQMCLCLNFTLTVPPQNVQWISLQGPRLPHVIIVRAPQPPGVCAVSGAQASAQRSRVVQIHSHAFG